MSPRRRKTHKWLAHAASKYAISLSHTRNSIMVQKTRAINLCSGPKSHVWSRSMAKHSAVTPSICMNGDSWMMRLASFVCQNVAVKGTGLCSNLICVFLAWNVQSANLFGDVAPFVDRLYGRERERLKPVNRCLKISWRLKPGVSHI